MKKIIIVIIAVAAIISGYFYFSNPKKIVLNDSDFVETDEYICDEGNTIGVAFADNVIRLSLSDKRVFTLEKISSDDESGTKFADDGNKIAFWIKDSSAFLEENGITTYAGCRTRDSYLVNTN